MTDCKIGRGKTINVGGGCKLFFLGVEEKKSFEEDYSKFARWAGREGGSLIY